MSSCTDICHGSKPRHQAFCEALRSTLPPHLTYLKLPNFPLSLCCQLPGTATEHGLCLLIEPSRAPVLLPLPLAVELLMPINLPPRGFPGGEAVGSLPANAGDTGSSPGLGRSHMPRSNWAREPQLLSLRVWSLCSTTTEATIEARAPR